MPTQIIIKIASEAKDRFSKLARIEGKTPSQMVRERIGDYIKDGNIDTYIGDLWNRIGGKLKSKGEKQRDIRSVIKETRKVPR